MVCAHRAAPVPAAGLVVDDAAAFDLFQVHAFITFCALRAAWSFLGQDERRLPLDGPVDALLRLAIAAFDPARVPRGAHAPSLSDTD